MRMLLISAAVAVAIATGCEKEEALLGEAVPTGVEQASVQDLAQDATRFAGTTVAVEGRISGGCSDGDGVVLSDETWRIEVKTSPSARFQIPVRAGERIRAWGVVGVEKEEGEHGEEEAEETHEESEVVVVARGVEWL
ncbi:MAG: hypothetical protein SFX73_34655 [Kofleriaceae bacterium]|nr:hypothetical protein [Kofleriaceae bacterium]